ncbi:c-type cytochrome [Rhodobacterales bacterium HKCCE2091]|nr:c-type cytochrome [Rhodobacterales bacterium HKCCE2091]
MKTYLISAAILAAAAPALAQETAPSRDGGFGLGRAALPEEVAAWDIDIRPDGAGLPAGSGNVWTGEELFVDQCSACHGDFGEAVGRWPQLAGGFGTLDGEDPVKTVGSYWPYLSTVWDYVHRAMPYGNAGSLSADDTYAIVAYLMYLNNMVEDDFVLSDETFLDVEMPNAGGFYMDDRDTEELPLFSAEPCMESCADSIEVTMRAAVLDVTPEGDGGGIDLEGGGGGSAAAPAAAEEAPAPEPEGPDPALVAEGESLFRQCSACHQIGEGASNRVGPALNGIVGAEAGTREGFRYSPALAEAGITWTHENLAAYLLDPRGFISGNRMAFRGLRDAAEAEAMIAYLQSAGGE